MGRFRNKLVIRLLIVSVFASSFALSGTGPTAGAGSPQPDSPIMACGPSFFAAKGAAQASLNCEHAACLDELALRLEQDPEAILVIDGHRDVAERKGISLTRANHARRYLIEDKGIDSGRIVVRNFSDTCPHESEDVDLNRRLEYLLVNRKAYPDEAPPERRCGRGATARIVTAERPARWKWDWKSEALR